MELPSTSSFQQSLNSIFKIKTDTETPLLLAEVNLSSSSDAKSFENISLIFHSQEELQQNTYALTHKDLGTLQLFLVPVGKQQEQYQYEALINRQTH